MPVKNWYATRALRFAILYVVALAAIKLFAVLAALAATATIFDNPARIAILAALGIGWPTFAPHHFDWLRSLAFAEPASRSLGGAAVIWAPFAIVAVGSTFLGIHAAVTNDMATTWALAGMLALTEREHPRDRKRLKRDADDALRRLVASYDAIYGPTRSPVPIFELVARPRGARFSDGLGRSISEL